MKFGYLIEIPSVADEIMERLSNNVVIGLIADAVVLQPIAFLSLFWPAIWDVCGPILLFLNAVLLLTALAYLIFALVYHLFFQVKTLFLDILEGKVGIQYRCQKRWYAYDALKVSCCKDSVQFTILENCSGRHKKIKIIRTRGFTDDRKKLVRLLCEAGCAADTACGSCIFDCYAAPKKREEVNRDFIRYQRRAYFQKYHALYREQIKQLWELFDLAEQEGNEEEILRLEQRYTQLWKENNSVFRYYNGDTDEAPDVIRN